MINVQTAASLATGNYTLTIRVARSTNDAQYVEHVLTVTVTSCEVTGLSISSTQTTPLTYIVEVTNTQVNLGISTTKTPACSDAVTYSLVYAPSFLSIDNDGKLVVTDSSITTAA